MSGTTDNIKGKAKEAVGDITDNDDLEREGKIDQASGKIKDTLDGAKDKIEDAVDAVKDKLSRKE